jgi:hypothetical protein
MSYETIQANTEDVRRALVVLKGSIDSWIQVIQDIEASGEVDVSVAMGPFEMGRIPGPPPPFSGCEGDFLNIKPQTGCLMFDVDIYVQQIAGLFMGIYHGLAQDSNLTE